MSSGRVKLTETFLKDLRDGKLEKNYYGDTEVPGLFVRRIRTGSIVFLYRYSAGKQKTVSLGVWGKKRTLTQARTEAEKRRGHIAEGRDPADEQKAARRHTSDAKNNTVNHVLDEYVAKYMEPENLRSKDAIVSIFDRLVRPEIGDRSIYSLEPSDMAGLLDGISAAKGRTMAARTKAWLRAAFNWWTGRDGRFKNPITKGTFRTNPVKSERKRVLSPDEVRDVCEALETANVPDPFQRFFRMLLLTGLRRADVSRAKWDEVSGNRLIIPSSRHKSENDHLVPVTDEVRRLLGPPRKRGYCFSTDPKAGTSIKGFGKWKVKIDREIARKRKEKRLKKMPSWQLSRDIRRTQMTMMMDLKIPRHIGDRVQGRTIKGSTVTYDRSDYEAQKTDALEKVAAKLEEILSGKNKPS